MKIYRCFFSFEICIKNNLFVGVLFLLCWLSAIDLYSQPSKNTGSGNVFVAQHGDSILCTHLRYHFSMDRPLGKSLLIAQNGKLPSSVKKADNLKGLVEQPALSSFGLEIWVTDSMERVESVNIFGKTTFLINKNDSLYRQIELDPSTQTAYEGAIGMPAVIFSSDSVIITDPKEFILHETDIADTLLNIPVKYAHFDANNNKRILVWYTENFPTIYWDKYSYLKQLPGAAIVILGQMDNAQIGIRLISVASVYVEKHFFEVPLTYKVIDINELQQEEKINNEIEQSDIQQDPPFWDELQTDKN